MAAAARLWPLRSNASRRPLTTQIQRSAEVYGGVECYGRAASAYAKRTLTGRRVRWRYDVGKRDRYDRALVYLWLDDGRFFNSMLVREGFATPLTVPPNVEFADRFVADARAARRSSRGLWSACDGARG